MAVAVARRAVPVKAAVFILALLPLAWLIQAAFSGGLGANPIEATNRFLGDWALRFLILTLAITPLRALSGWSALARLRRMIGLFAFFYLCLHLLSYIGLDQFFDWGAIGRDILKRRFITVGMAAALILLPLAATSTNAMIRRMGGARWRTLHRWIYAAVPLAVWHYWMMVKADHRTPLVYAAVVAILLGWRIWTRARRDLGSPPTGATR
jgi:methionine sulfoxide reductase heme-binding subunit